MNRITELARNMPWRRPPRLTFELLSGGFAERADASLLPAEREYVSPLDETNERVVPRGLRTPPSLP